MAASETRPVTTFDDYLRRYLPSEARPERQGDAIPGHATQGTEAAREAVEKVEAGLRADFAASG